MDLNLTGKTVIVTGGASNIGRGIVLAFAKEKANIVIADIAEADAQKVVEQANQAGAKAIAIKADATDFNSATAMVKSTLEQFGQVDVLVNNAGGGSPRPFHKKPLADWDKELDVNLRTTLNCTRAVLDHMIGRKYGKIVNISSDAGRMGGYMVSIYAAGKGGVIAFTKALARELGPYSINVNVICPGIIVPDKPEDLSDTSMLKGSMAFLLAPDVLKEQVRDYPLGRPGKPSDIANLAVFLASDASSFITGQTISVDGGWTMM
jgi:2-hydroxycyclohexanecarboxyl-CoA dehydrogenase